MFLFIKTISILFILSVSGRVIAQDNNEDTDINKMLDEVPLSIRAAAMGGGAITDSEYLDATYQNPAGISGLYESDQKSFIKKFQFPNVSASTNTEAYQTIKEFRGSGAESDSSISSAIIDAHSGKRQFASINFVPNFLLGKLLIAPYYHQQLAAVAKGNETDEINLKYRTESGIGMGSSVSDNKKRLFLGYYFQQLSRSETSGEVNYFDILDKSSRNSTLKALSNNYSANVQHLGLIWRMAKTGLPTLGIAVRNMGSPNLEDNATGKSTVNKVREDLGVGFSYTLEFDRDSALLMNVQMDQLTNNEISLNEKARAGIEWTYGGRGKDAPFALRVGGNSGGASFGIALNLGLIYLDGSSYVQDVGLGNKSEFERRYAASFGIDIATP